MTDTYTHDQVMKAFREWKKSGRAEKIAFEFYLKKSKKSK